MSSYYDAFNKASDGIINRSKAELELVPTASTAMLGETSGGSSVRSGGSYSGFSNEGVSGVSSKGLGQAATAVNIGANLAQSREAGLLGNVLGGAATLSNPNATESQKAMVGVNAAASVLGASPMASLGLNAINGYSNEGVRGAIDGVATGVVMGLIGMPGAVINGVSSLMGGPTVQSMVRSAVDAVDDYGGFSDGAKSAASFNADVAAMSGLGSPGFGVADTRAGGALNSDPTGTQAAREAARTESLRAQNEADGNAVGQVGGWSSDGSPNAATQSAAASAAAAGVANQTGSYGSGGGFGGGKTGGTGEGSNGNAGNGRD